MRANKSFVLILVVVLGFFPTVHFFTNIGWHCAEAKINCQSPATNRQRPEAFLMEEKQKSTLQLIWGILLLMAGIGVFFRIPQIMPEIKKIAHFAPYIGFIYFCFYLIGVLLVVGGGRKVYNHLKSKDKEEAIDR